MEFGESPRFSSNDPSNGIHGLSASSDYQNLHLKIEPGETLVLYTDGVTETFDPNHQLYGDERLLETVGKPGLADPSNTNKQILASVSDFANGANQSDNVSLLTLRFGDSK